MRGLTGRAIAAATLAISCGRDGQAEPPTATADAPPVVHAAEASPPDAWGPAVRPLADAAAERDLVLAELRRDPRAPALRAALASDDPEVVGRAAWSLARIGGPAAVEHFTEWLDGGQERPAVGLAAIAALPGSPSPSSDLAELEERLWHRYAVTEDPDVAIALLLAIARVGGEPSRDRLAADLSVLPDAADEPRWTAGMESLAILCRRGVALSVAGVQAVQLGLQGEPAVRRAAAVALERCAGPSAEELAGPSRLSIVQELGALVAAGSDPEDAHAAWAALAALGELPSAIPVDVLGDEPRAWRVEVAAVHALAAHADGRRALATRLAGLDLSRIEGPRWHVVLEALRGLRPAMESTPELLELLGPLHASIDAARVEADARARKALVLARCELTVLQAIGRADTSAVEHCADGEAGISPTHGARLAIDAILRTGPAMSAAAKADALLARASDPRADVAAAALAAMAEIDDPRVGPALRDAIAGDDVGIVSAAAASIGARAVDRQRRDPSAVPALVAAIGRLDDDHAVEARVAAIDALGNLARSAATPSVPGPPAAAEAVAPVAPPPDWLEQGVLPLCSDANAAVRGAARRALADHPALLARFDASVPQAFANGFAPAVHEAVKGHAGSRGLRVVTSAGAFTIDFAGAPAPIAQANLTALAAKGFFDGLGFHRVVPDFVIQGGDPRGDGYGGPGHVMPCEWSNLRFQRGTVGIALAGKDTGGSQIFVAHGRPVHLDARFSVVGRVTDGMDVVDAILPYDTIERVEIVEGDVR